MGKNKKKSFKYFVLPETAYGTVEMIEPPVEELPITALVGTHCVVDGREIQVMAFKMTGICSEWCRKRHEGLISEEVYLAARPDNG